MNVPLSSAALLYVLPALSTKHFSSDICSLMLIELCLPPSHSFFAYLFQQSPAGCPSLASNPYSSCHGLLGPGMSGVYHHPLSSSCVEVFCFCYRDVPIAHSVHRSRHFTDGHRLFVIFSVSKQQINRPNIL